MPNVLGEDISIPVGTEIENLSDGYHTFKELYDTRLVLAAALFNQWAKDKRYYVHKAKRHYDNELPFGGGWFIVSALLPNGLISYHFPLSEWDRFRIPSHDHAQFPYDGHKTNDVVVRLGAI